jgi:hypothetical protein
MCHAGGSLDAAPARRTAIPNVVTLRQVSRSIRANPHYAKGFAEGMGIELEEAGRALIMSAKDFDRLKKKHAKIRSGAEARASIVHG